MLEAVRLPSNLWGEAVLIVAYLWNHTESNSLPAGVTPYEIVNHHKPDLSHLKVFSSSCWAHISTELQTKFGAHSCRAIFLGYPDGIKGYCVRDASTGAFFVARDIEFNEVFPDLTNSDSNFNSDTPVPPSGLTSVVPSTPAKVPRAPFPPAPNQRSGTTPRPTEVRRSTQPQKPTKKGAA